MTGHKLPAPVTRSCYIGILLQLLKINVSTIHAFYEYLQGRLALRPWPRQPCGLRSATRCSSCTASQCVTWPLDGRCTAGRRIEEGRRAVSSVTAARGFYRVHYSARSRRQRTGCASSFLLAQLCSNAVP